MEPDYLLSASRWKILEVLSRKRSSPIQIAEELNTTVSYVSQQLRLLEATGLIKKEKTGEVGKGKPRTLFGISEEVVYIVTLAKQFSKKKLLKLEDHHKTILKIWLLEDKKLHYYVQKFYWRVEKYLDDIEAIFVDTTGLSPKIIIISDKKIKSKIESSLKDMDEKIDFEIIQKNKMSNLDLDNIFPIYDNSSICRERKKLKGGAKTKDGIKD